LEQWKIVHRALTAHNVLLQERGQTAKLSDCSLTQALYNLDKPIGQDKLPIKWYPPQCFDDVSKYDSKADVWSFAVTMWEATSYGQLPFKEMNTTEYKQRVAGGYRLSKPPNCLDTLYHIMCLCWQLEEDGRPSFKRILSYFDLVDKTDSPMETSRKLLWNENNTDHTHSNYIR